MNDPIRAGLYCRPTRATISAECLLASLKHIAALRSWRVIATNTDQPTRAASMRSDRAGLDALLAAAAHREIDVVVVPSLSHLASTLPKLVEIAHALGEHGVDLYSDRDSIDTTTPGGKTAFTAFAALAAFERDQFRERATASLDRARSSGTRLGRPSNANLPYTQPSVRCTSAARRFGVSPDSCASGIGPSIAPPREPRLPPSREHPGIPITVLERLCGLPARVRTRVSA